MERLPRFHLEVQRRESEGRLVHRHGSIATIPSERPDAPRVLLGPDPSVMLLPRPRAMESVLFRKLGALAECGRGPRVRLDPRDRRWRERLDRSIADYGRGLCRRIDPNQAVAIWAAFLEALDTIETLPARAGSRWFERPWYAIDPRHFFERRLPARGADLARGLNWIERLGFDNVLLLSDLDELASFEPAVAQARQNGLHFLASLDLDRTSESQPVWLAGRDPASPELIRTALARLARDVSSGLSGEHLHHVDRWARAVEHPSEGAPSAHALVALFKLFLRLADADQIVLADYAQAGGNVSTLVGGDLPADRARSTESDLVLWDVGVGALRRALVDRDSRPLAEALASIPTLGHGAALACALEVEGGRRLAEILDGDRDRITLALACLYAMPAIPIVHAGMEVGARGAHLLEHWFLEADASLPVHTLRALNRSRPPAAKHPRVRWLDRADCSLVAWANDDVLFVANLAGTTVDVHLDQVGAAQASLEPVRRAELSLNGLALRLGPHGFGRFQLSRPSSDHRSTTRSRSRSRRDTS